MSCFDIWFRISFYNDSIAFASESSLLLFQYKSAYSSTFSSIFAKGEVALVEDLNEKRIALELIMENQSGKHFEITDSMCDSVHIIKFVVKELSAKEKKW